LLRFYPKSSIGINRRGCGGYGGWEKLRIRSAAKSIAPCRMHLQKKLHGGLRGEKWGTPRIPTPLLRYRTATPQKNQL